jgi:hypothetical protein
MFKAIRTRVLCGWLENRNGFRDIREVLVELETLPGVSRVWISGIGYSGKTLRGVLGMTQESFAQVCRDYLAVYEKEAHDATTQ